jgi:hypothetical protein
MQNIETILKVVYAVASAVAVAVPLVIALIANIKSKIKIHKQLANTTDEAEKAKLEAANSAATTDMLNVCNELIANAETLYSDVSSILKKEGKSAGAVKKDSVMSKLQAYAIERGYEFDAEYWDKKVDEIVDMTKKVNVSK